MMNFKVFYDKMSTRSEFMKKILYLIGALILAFLLAFTITLDFINISKKETFKENDFQITLTNDFKANDLAGATAYFESNKAIVVAKKEDLKDLKDLGIKRVSSLEDYAKVILRANDSDYTLQKKGNIIYYEYESKVEDNLFYYFVTVAKSDDAFWVISFASHESNKNIYKPEFIKWAKSIKV